MQPYEPSRAHHPYRDQGRIHGIPGMRLSHETSASGGSATPIYDALFAEWGRLFRTLPGDRTGEEELRFEGFGTVHGTGQWGDSRRGGEWPHEALPQSGAQRPAALPPGSRDGNGNANAPGSYGH